MPINSIIRGDDIFITVEIKDLQDAAIPIAGDILFFTIKNNKTDADAQAVHAVSEYVPAGADATAGVHKFQLPNNLPVNTFVYDIQWKRIVSGMGEVVTLEIDTITVTQDVTLQSTG